MKKGKALTALRRARREIERELAGLVGDLENLTRLVAAIEREIAILETMAGHTERGSRKGAESAEGGGR